jgi:hypothetical protein
MLSQVHQQKHSRFNQFAQSSLFLIEATFITSIIGAIASTQPNGFLSSSAFAQGIQSSDQTVLVDHQSNASQLGGVVPTNCLQAEDMGVRPEHCDSIGPIEPPRLNPDSSPFKVYR